MARRRRVSTSDTDSASGAVQYGKAIAFDYSYKYFYDDGYGKDFQILNLREETTGDQTDILLLANLLSFYEQKRSFVDQAERLRLYGIEHPLWIFVGSSVNAVYTEEKRKRSDVLTILCFLHRFLENRRNWTVRTIEKVMQGKTELRDPYGREIRGEREISRLHDKDPTFGGRPHRVGKTID